MLPLPLRALAPSLVALALAAAPAAAQGCAGRGECDTAALLSGDRLRIRTGDGRATYRLIDTAADTLVVERSGGAAPQRIALASVERLERSLGRHSRGRGFARGAAIGGVAGVGVGLVGGVVVAREEDVMGLAPLVAGAAAVVYGATGALLGGLVGMSAPGERWERVDAARRVTVAPMHGGMGVRVAF